MDALSSLASIAGSNALAGIGAPASGNPGPDPALPVSSPASVSVFLSDFAKGLLAQQASDPTLDIDTAFARSVLGLTQNSANDGQLFTSSGLLQPFTPSLLLAQPASTSTDNTNGPIPDPNTVGVAQQAVLTSEESLLNTQNDTGIQTANIQTNTAAAVNKPVNAPTVTPSSVANTQSPDLGTPLNTETGQQTTSAAVVTPANVQPATSTVANNDIIIAADRSSVIAQDQTPSDTLDPFQQAVLIAGLTSFGKEQNNFVPAASDGMQSAIQGVVTIMPVRARNHDSTEAWLHARR